MLSIPDKTKNEKWECRLSFFAPRGATFITRTFSRPPLMILLVVSRLLGHSSVTVTTAVYGHLTAGDARVALQQADWFTGREMTW